ncbi:hypothetical protein [Micromonospora thermarum]|uniref:hypothetical protein n=1 Tax=Micromonospora thermarum TaxID=2720024 RepID=UPI0035A0611F
MGAVSGRVLRGRTRRRPAGGPGVRGNPAGGWQVVTVDRAPGTVLPGGRWPEPLRRLGGAIQVEVRPAPGCRGTELAARPRPGVPLPGLAAHVVGDDPARAVRAALRQAKQLAETGEVLRADRTPMDRGRAG